jgi:hypothetical protein
LTDARNFERDHWRPAIAVAHLAGAWVETLIEQGKRGDPPDVVRFVTDAEFVERFVVRAHEMEALVETSDLKIPSSILIKFRL